MILTGVWFFQRAEERMKAEKEDAKDVMNTDVEMAKPENLENSAPQETKIEKKLVSEGDEGKFFSSQKKRKKPRL